MEKKEKKKRGKKQKGKRNKINQQKEKETNKQGEKKRIERKNVICSKSKFHPFHKKFLAKCDDFEQ